MNLKLKSQMFILIKEKIILDNSLSLRKYKILEGFHHGIHPKSSGTGYIQFYNDNFFIVSAKEY